MQTIQSRGLTAGSLFKLVFIGLAIPMFLLSFTFGLFSLFGFDVVMFNNEYVYGFTGLFTSIMIGLLLPLVFASMVWVCVILGTWIFTRFHTITLKVKQ